jgi:hypothetical protein
VRHAADVQVDLEALPDDPEVLQQMLGEVVSELSAENEKLWLLVQRMLRHRYGPRSEKLDLDQLQLGLEDAEQDDAEHAAAEEVAAPSPRRRHTEPANRNRGALPAHLPHRYRQQGLPLLWQRAARDRRGPHRAARHRAGGQLFGFGSWGETWNNSALQPNRGVASAGGGIRLILTRFTEFDLVGVSRFVLNPSGAGVTPLQSDALYWRVIARF